MILDIFKDNFSLTEMTEAINILPNRYDRVIRLGLFEDKALTQNTVTIEEKDGMLQLVQTQPWGAPATQHSSAKRKTRSFSIPHMPYETMLQAADVMGVRAFGSETELETISAKVSEKMDEMKINIDQTLEYRQFGALKGRLLDADGSTLLDLFTEYGIAQTTVDFSTGNAKDKALGIKRLIEDNLKGDTMNKIHCLCSPEFFDSYTNKTEVKAAYDNYQEAAQRLGGDMRSGFEHAGIMYEENRAQVGAERFLEAGEAIFFPLGTRQTFRNFLAPADFVETVNTRALPYYARQWLTSDNRGVMMHVQANQLPICMRPAVLIKGAA